MLWLMVVASASNWAGAGLSNFKSTLAPLTLTRLPLSSSTCTEASASDMTRPATNLPASSNNKYMGSIVPRAGLRLVLKGFKFKGKAINSAEAKDN